MSQKSVRLQALNSTNDENNHSTNVGVLHAEAHAQKGDVFAEYRGSYTEEPGR